MSRIGKVALIAFAVITFARPAGATTIIDFNNLVAPNGTPFTTTTENGYTVSVLTGSWFVGQIFGNPVPDIFLGPVGSPTPGSISISGPLFTPLSVDLACNNGSTPCIASFQGLLNGSQVFFDGPSPFVTALNTFLTAASPHPNAVIDTLIISLTPGNGTTSMNVDTLVGNTVPEPGTLALFGTGLMLAWRRVRRA
jgi:hypothetical protein